MACPTPIGTRHGILVLAHEGMCQGDIAARVVVVRKAVNRLPMRLAATASLNQGSEQELLERPQPAKNTHSSEWSVKTTSRLPGPSQRMRNLCRVRVCCKTINNWHQRWYWKPDPVPQHRLWNISNIKWTFLTILTRMICYFYTIHITYMISRIFIAIPICSHWDFVCTRSSCLPHYWKITAATWIIHTVVQMGMFTMCCERGHSVHIHIPYITRQNFCDAL